MSFNRLAKKSIACFCYHSFETMRGVRGRIFFFLLRCLVTVLGNGAGLGGEGEGDLVAVGFSENNLDLINGVGSIFELGNVEALLLLDVLANDLGELDGLGHAGLDGFGSGDINVDDEGDGDDGNGVLLGLVFVLAELVLSGIAVSAGGIPGSVTGGHSHGLGLGLGGHLTGCQDVYLFPFILSFPVLSGHGHPIQI